MKSNSEKRSTRRRKFYKSVIGLFSLSTMLFVFQCCYGTPQDFGQDVHISGSVQGATSNSNLEGIKVSFKNLPQYTQTDANGSFSMYCPLAGNYELIFEDVDGDNNGVYQKKDTVITRQPDQYELNVEIQLD